MVTFSPKWWLGFGLLGVVGLMKEEVGWVGREAGVVEVLGVNCRGRFWYLLFLQDKLFGLRVLLVWYEAYDDGVLLLMGLRKNDRKLACVLCIDKRTSRNDRNWYM